MIKSHQVIQSTYRVIWGWAEKPFPLREAAASYSNLTSFFIICLGRVLPVIDNNNNDEDDNIRLNDGLDDIFGEWEKGVIRIIQRSHMHLILRWLLF